MRLALVLLGAVVVAALSPEGPAAGRRGRPATPTVARTHLRYTWQERVDALVVSHELNLYGNGFIRYLQRPGLGTPHETTLPNDPAFVAEAERLFLEAQSARVTRPLCGAPQGGLLQVQLGRRVSRFDLARVEEWSRYGRLARLLLGRVVGALPAALEADCQPLKLRVDPGRVATAPRAPKKLGTARDESKLLLAYSEAETDEARRALLYELATVRDGDRFFRLALVRQHGGTLEARRLLRQHASVLVRGVRSEDEARELLPHLASLGSAEALYHRAVLERVLGRHEEAARTQHGFRQALNQLGVAAKATEELRALGAAEVSSHRIQPPWAVVRGASTRLFLGWLDLAQEVWAGDPEEAPPLAILLYRRALHYAAGGVLASGLRAGPRSALARARAWALLRTHLGRLMHGRWDALPHWARQDLLEVLGLLRRTPPGRDRAWMAKVLEDPSLTICRMIRMQYFDVAERFLLRMVESRKAPEGRLRLAQGVCLREMEQFVEARRALAQAIAQNEPGARVANVQLLLDLGDLDAAEREVEAVSPKTAAAWRAQSRLYRLLGQGVDAREAAERAAVAGRATRATAGTPGPLTMVALGRASSLLGRSAEARSAFQQAAVGQGAVAQEARERWARLELSLGRARAALAVAWPLTQERDPVARVAGNALVALAAARLSMPSLARLQMDRARYHAHRDPRALLRLALILSEGGHGHATALEALRLAIGLRPGWSVLYAQQALLWGQLRRLPEALSAISAALQIRRAFPPYRALESALLKLAAARKGGAVHDLPPWAREPGVALAPDGGAPDAGAPRTRARPAGAPTPGDAVAPRPTTDGGAVARDARAGGIPVGRPTAKAPSSAAPTRIAPVPRAP